MNSWMLLNLNRRINGSANLAVHRKDLRNNFDPLTLTDKAFQSNFRVSKQIFMIIHDGIKEELMPFTKRGLTSEQQLAVTLKFLAQGSYQQGVGNDFTVPIGQSTFSKVFDRTLRIMETTLCAQEISLRMDEDEQQEAKRYFYEKTGISGVVMCVDGTHIRIVSPRHNRVMFYNRKGFYSLNVMVICDHKRRIRCVDARFSGSNHDSYIFNRSSAASYFETKWRNGERFKLLGDSAYAAKPWLIKPFRDPEPNSPEETFNLKHAQGRGIIERTFGTLKNKFRCLLGARQLHYTPAKCVKMVNVCCALHNMCIKYNISEPLFEDEY